MGNSRRGPGEAAFVRRAFGGLRPPRGRAVAALAAQGRLHPRSRLGPSRAGRLRARGSSAPGPPRRPGRRSPPAAADAGAPRILHRNSPRHRLWFVRGALRGAGHPVFFPAFRFRRRTGWPGWPRPSSTERLRESIPRWRSGRAGGRWTPRPGPSRRRLSPSLTWFLWWARWSGKETPRASSPRWPADAKAAIPKWSKTLELLGQTASRAAALFPDQTDRAAAAADPSGPSRLERAGLGDAGSDRGARRRPGVRRRLGGKAFGGPGEAGRSFLCLTRRGPRAGLSPPSPPPCRRRSGLVCPV